MVTSTQISNQLAAARINGLLQYFRQAARRWNIPVEILLAVASRETQIGTNRFYLNNNFTGRDGHGKGIMQIDDRFHNFARITAPNDHRAMINHGAQFLSDLKKRFGNMKDALSAYNAGPSAVMKAYMQGVDPDSKTTGGNYSRDVLRRAQLIKDQLGITTETAAFNYIPAILLLAAGSGFLYTQLQKQNLLWDNY
ncbi:Transglycosylase SLT domain-containing protein [Fodinibius salinus]|uniref:Transglycosylase SLT domain-containing protein n=1 Tax=Fodinibius salinus TaxID=860790 RepID=A0A5D3YG76_9BACT|nr:transglycosylase SLT domain-containing protein [Fodinibius salinus]TYP92091.1 Transglycosylase SLT domain-containing protein [Fodinibius salinus]